MLETLRPADQVLIINHDGDEVEETARYYGATVKAAVPGVSDGAYAVDADHDWILCLLANESITEGLEASLHEWKEQEHEPNQSFGVGTREQTEAGWQTRAPETRLVNRKGVNWTGDLPLNDSSSQPLGGEVLRLA
jgi:hypothetical protein